MAARNSSARRTFTVSRDGLLLLAVGAPGAELDAEVVSSVSVGDLAFAETCAQDEAEADPITDGSDWSVDWPDD